MKFNRARAGARPRASSRCIHLGLVLGLAALGCAETDPDAGPPDPASPPDARPADARAASPPEDAAPEPDAAAPDAAVPDAQTGGGGDATPLSMDPRQGPLGQGTLVYSQDFEEGMAGMSRSPNDLPEDRIQIVDDPVSQRGKVVRIVFQQGDNFRTSGGTQPRSWFSAAMGYTIRPGTKVSVAWGFMWENPSMGAHFAQIIRNGGPLWMFGVNGGGTASARVHRGSGGGGAQKIEAMKWYDFRVDTDYRNGGEIKFFINGEQVGTGRGDGGDPARFDCGTYWMGGARPGRTVYVSNVSIAEMP